MSPRPMAPIPAHVATFCNDALQSVSAAANANARFYEAFGVGIPDASADEGEGGRTLAGSREALRAHYAKVCASLGRERSADAPLVCERFRVFLP